MEGKKYTFSEKREEKHVAKLGVLAVKELAVHQNITGFQMPGGKPRRDEKPRHLSILRVLINSSF
jgi:hypothetical protein